MINCETWTDVLLLECVASLFKQTKSLWINACRMSSSISRAKKKKKNKPNMTSLQVRTRLVSMVTVLCVIILTLPPPRAKWAVACVCDCICKCVCVCVCVCVCADWRVWSAVSKGCSICFCINTGWLVGLENDPVAKIWPLRGRKSGNCCHNSEKHEAEEDQYVRIGWL